MSRINYRPQWGPELRRKWKLSKEIIVFKFFFLTVGICLSHKLQRDKVIEADKKAWMNEQVNSHITPLNFSLIRNFCHFLLCLISLKCARHIASNIWGPVNWLNNGDSCNQSQFKFNFSCAFLQIYHLKKKHTMSSMHRDNYGVNQLINYLFAYMVRIFLKNI